MNSMFKRNQKGEVRRVSGIQAGNSLYSGGISGVTRDLCTLNQEEESVRCGCSQSTLVLEYIN